MQSVSGVKVLLVDDNETNRYVISRNLNLSGYEVVVGTTAAEAFRFAQNQPDVIILDVNLPDLSGREVCRRLKADPVTRAIPIMQISADFIRPQDHLESHASGSDAYLTHPIGADVLDAAIRSLLRIKSVEKEKDDLLKKYEQHFQMLETERSLRRKFVSTLSHDLRSSVSTAKMASELLEESVADVNQVRKIAKMIDRNLARAISMIEDLLDADGIQGGELPTAKFESCDLSIEISECLRDLESIYGNRFIFKIEDHIKGTFDARYVRRILENLTLNALKYGSEDSKVSITFTREKSLAVLSVHNFGNPIPECDQATIFDMFRRASATVKKARGWGIGLAIVKSLTDAHLGEVELESSEASGTCFTVRLPIK